MLKLNLIRLTNEAKRYYFLLLTTNRSNAAITNNKCIKFPRASTKNPSAQEIVMNTRRKYNTFFIQHTLN